MDKSDKVTDKAEKHLHSNKFMRTANVLSDFLERNKGRAFGLLKVAYEMKAKGMRKNTL